MVPQTAPVDGPHGSGPRFATPGVAAWIKDTPLPTSLAFQQGESSASSNDDSEYENSKKKKSIGPVAPGRSSDRYKGMEIHVEPKADSGGKKSSKKKSKKKSKRKGKHKYDDSVTEDSESENDEENVPLPSDWVNPVGNGVIYYNPAKPTTKYFAGNEGAKKVVKKEGALSASQLKKLQKAAKKGDLEPEEDAAENINPEEEEDSDERENMNEWVKKKALELAKQKNRKSARKSGRPLGDSDDDNKPILLTGRSTGEQLPKGEGSLEVTSPTIKINPAALRDELFLKPGRSRVAVKKSDGNKSDGSTEDEGSEAGSDDEDKDRSTDEDVNGKDEQDEEDLATAAARLSRLGFNESSATLLPDSAPLPPETMDDALQISDFQDDSKTETGVSLLTNIKIKGPNGELVDAQEFIGQLEEKKNIALYSDNEPAEALDACKYIIENVQYMENEPDLEKQLCEAAIKCLKKLSNLGPNLPPRLNIISADATQLLANLYVSGIPGLKTVHKADYARAFPLYLSAAKKEHPDGAFHVGLCYEQGAGVAASNARAVQYYKKSALRHVLLISKILI
jgi:hypothetical protein